ncbi:MAG TPA: hypothetical protein VN520_29965 [Streptomyces sp.]|nr:hypothetical protein [Streptomyces sp.]HWU10541.1 hypothetical protein [Streptomyces sp.]
MSYRTGRAPVPAAVHVEMLQPGMASEQYSDLAKTRKGTAD